MTNSRRHTVLDHRRSISRPGINLFMLLLLLTTNPAAAAEPLQITDDSHQQLTLSSPARRIISLAPHITELLYSAGAGAYIVGAISYSDYPPEALQIPRIGDHSGLDLEAILALKPDLIIAWPGGNPQAQLQQLQHMGLNIFNAEPHTLDDIPRTIEQLGYLAATTATATQAANDYRLRLNKLRQRYQGQAPVRVFFQIWEQPLITINDQHLISDVIHVCGGQNIFANLPALVPQISIEAVLQANPEAIITSAENGSDNHEQPATLEHWNQWQGLKASHNGHLYGINPAYISRHTARILIGAEQLCQDLHRVRQQAIETHQQNNAASPSPATPP